MFTIFEVAVTRLWNNKQELLLALIVPMLFFSIFALIFGQGIGEGTPAIEVAIVDDDQSPFSQQVASALKKQPAIKVELDVLCTNSDWPLARLTTTIIRDHRVDVVVYLPADTNRLLNSPSGAEIQLLAEGSNPVARQIVHSMLTQAVATAAATRTSPNQLTSFSPRLPQDVSRLPPSTHRASAPAATGGEAAVQFTFTDVFAEDKHNPKIAMYAAGIAVMFLLFSATGAGGSLLEEYEAGTLDRLLTTRLTLTQLLAGKWLYIMALGCVQLSVMFLWAQLIFDVDLMGHLPGFAIMTASTAAATASLALCLAVFCRSRAQLNGVSIVLILAMSALGGSMVPRYIMSESMQRWGQFTFNAWALDGFKKVFWYDLPPQALQTEVQVLLVMTVSLALIGRAFADRWAQD